MRSPTGPGGPDPSSVQAAIDRFQPKGCGVVPAVLATTRALVAAAEPRSVREVTWVMSYVYRFGVWADAGNCRFDAEALSSPETVEAFLDHVDPQPSGRRRMRSFLMRVGAGQLTPTAQPSGRTRRPSPTELAHRVLDQAVADDVAATIAAWKPSRIAADRWERVAGIVRAAVRSAQPGRSQRAQDLCRSAAYLAAWADDQHLPVDTDTVFDGATIEAFLTAVAGSGMPSRSAATHAANLHHIRAALGLREPASRRTWPAPDPAGPYTSDEIDRFFTQADHLATIDRRRYANIALLCLFGAGATPADLAHGTVDHVHIGDNDLTIEFTSPERTVVVLDTYRPALAAAVEELRNAGGRYLIGGDTSRDRQNRLSRLLTAGWDGKTKVDVDPGRARATWLVDVASQPGRHATIIDLLDEAGYRGCDRLNSVLDDIRSRLGDQSR